MAQNNQVDTIAASKPSLVTDLNSTYLGKDSYSHARNAVRNSREGDLGTIGNEPSTERCFSAPSKIIGSISLPDDKELIFSGEGPTSEIGIGDKRDCTYTRLSRMSCLNFSPDNPPITGVAKKDFMKGIVVTFTDKTNPVRRAELNKLANITNCDELLLWKKISHPCITVKKGQVGNMPNGSYSIAIAYSIEGQVFSDWLSISNRIGLYSETGANSIEVKLDGLDTEFDQFSVAVVGTYVDPTTKGATKLAKIVGTYSTKIKSLSITDFINSNYIDIPLGNLVIRKNSWQKAGIISSNSNYLVIADLVGRNEENYQLKAMGIETEYTVEQVPAEYYSVDGIDVGYYRDENYDFYIQGIYNTGEFTDKFHIPGPKPTAEDLQIMSGYDVYEHDKQFADCEEPGKIVRWQVENTAGKMIPTNDDLKCDRRLLGSGKTGVFLSTEPYPSNTAMFGEDAGTQQRFHKMPDECKVPRYSKIDGKYYINILGVRFKNIPKFESPDIVGYKITRSDRKGGNGTVIARGMMSNIRWFEDTKLNQTVMYSNYTVNDLRPDVYISAKQTAFKNGTERNFEPLTDYYTDRFSFYSPHTMFEPRYSLGTEVKIETEEVAVVRGQFEKVFNHPQMKLMNQFAFWLAAAVGFLQSSMVLLGKTDISTISGMKLAGIDVGPYAEIHNTIKIDTINDLIALSPAQLVDLVVSAAKAVDPSKVTTIIALIKAVIQSLTALGLKVPYSILSGIREADMVFDTIMNFTGYTDYVYQYNAHAAFDRSICVKTGNKRRRLKTSAKYIPSDLVTIDDKLFNNHLREKTVYLELNREINDPTVTDDTRDTISGFGICDDITKKTLATGSMFYATSKIPNPNQYGALGSALPVSMHSCLLEFDPEQETTISPILYGGDCVIAKFQFLKKMNFFNQDLANTNYPPGTEYDYKLYRNIGYPRFWMDSTKYDFSQLLSGNVINYTRFSRTTASRYNLDCKRGRDGGSIARIDNAYMYLSNNCVIDFFVECDYNINFREKTRVPHYSQDNTNLSQIFRSDKLELQEEFVVNRAFSDLYTTEIYAQQQREDFDPSNPIPVDQPNSVIYSLPSFNLQKVDNWQYFLPLNYFSFRESDFGDLTGVHKLDQDRVIFLFSKSSPYISNGRDFLTLDGSGRKITVGDGGLFAQDPREMMPTDNNYGACNSRYAFANTHLGRYFPSERQGRILESDNLNDITRAGMSYWCKNYMPIQLYKYFPTYPEVENPISGVGYLMAFDSFYETCYITKRDFIPKSEYINDLTFNGKSFMYKGLKVDLRSQYFKDISWTLSYSPLDKGFVSWHDWHPDWIIQTDNHFMSIKGDTVWKHNERFDDFCTFYDVKHPFEWEPVSSSGQSVEMVRSLEYILEVYKYKNFGRDRFHVHGENFDRLSVRNTEQMSPLLWMVKANPNPEENIRYPKKKGTDNVSMEIPFFKEENKYRVNMFWDAVRDRGEFSNAEAHLFPTDESGYKSVVNPVAIDLDKPEEQRKKFRHYWNKFRFTKTDCGEHKFLVKLLNIKKNISVR